MKFKKLAALVLTGALAASLAVPAFAADATITDLSNDATLNITGSTNVPTVKVTVPTTGTVILNPYKLEVELEAAVEADEDAGTEAKAAVTSKEQIISATQYILNEGTAPLSVNVAVTGTPAADVTLATASVGSNTKLTTKNVFMYLKMAPAAVAKDKDGAYVLDEDDNIVIAEPTSWGSYNKTTDALVSSEEVIKTNVITVPALVREADTDNDIPAIPGVVAFRLMGDAVSAPTESWTSSDTVSVKVVFTFTSVAN